MNDSPKRTQAEFRVHSNKLIDRTLRLLLPIQHSWFLRLRASLTRERDLFNGRVTIVVPFFNTAPYLRAALDSIRMQRYGDLDVILVDDGSTDGSTEIANEFARRDSRFRVLRTNRVGPGAARNIALKQTSGDFIAFVDGDDVLPTGAIYRLLSTLKRSGSDFAVGAFEHLAGTDRWRSPWVLQQHAQTREAVNLTEVPGITRNVFPWNKLFRRAFFEAKVGPFPEGIVYEDQIVTARAFAEARAFDVLTETVYLWRKRESGDSITQNRATIAHLENRITVLEELDAYYSTHAPDNAYREWLRKSLFEDMLPFIEISDRGDELFRARLSALCNEWLHRLTMTERALAGAHNRMMIEAAASADYSAAWQLRDSN